MSKSIFYLGVCAKVEESKWLGATQLGNGLSVNIGKFDAYELSF